MTTPWADPGFAAKVWPDAPGVDPTALDAFLDAATEACQEYARPLPDDAPAIPDRYKLACVLHARELWSATIRDGDVIGVGDYTVRVRPLSGTVKQLLRPVSAPPRFGVRTTP